MKPLNSLIATALLVGAPLVHAQQVISLNITEEEVLSSQRQWEKGLVEISKAYDAKGHAAAKAMAEKVIDSTYDYSYGPVLFKPTLTSAPQTFRTDREGALSYFVGGNPKYPNDTGFALKGWRNVDIQNIAIYLFGKTAVSMGKVHFTDKNGKITSVDKSWGFRKDDDGTIRMVMHHSSLGVPPPAPAKGK